MNAPLVTHTARIGKHTVTFRVGIGSFDAEWSPKLPRKLSADEEAQYRAARNAAIEKAAAHFGIGIMVIEV